MPIKPPNIWRLFLLQEIQHIILVKLKNNKEKEKEKNELCRFSI